MIFDEGKSKSDKGVIVMEKYLQRVLQKSIKSNIRVKRYLEALLRGYSFWFGKNHNIIYHSFINPFISNFLF